MSAVFRSTWDMKLVKRLVFVTISVVLFFILKPSTNSESTAYASRKVDSLLDQADEAMERVSEHKVFASATSHPAGSVKPSANVFLFTYMRGGSSLLGDLFNYDPDVFYWYEPLTQFYSHAYGVAPMTSYDSVVFNEGTPQNGIRRLPEWESELLADYVNYMYQCDLTKLPPEAMGNLRFMRHPLATLPFYACFLEHSAMSPQTPFKPDDIRDFAFSAFEWDMTCKNRSGVSEFCSANRGVKPDCHMVLSEFRRQDLSDNKLSQIQNLMVQQTDFAASKIERMLEGFDEHGTCQENIKSIINRCIASTNIISTCQNKHFKITKCLRVKMANFEPIIKRVPDLKVIYYVRDPRAIAYSQAKRNKKKVFSQESFPANVDLVCEEMLDDIKVRLELEKKYHEVFLQVRYEDLVIAPRATVNRMYSHIGQKEAPQLVFDWMEEAFNSTQGDGTFGTHRTNATSLIDAWKRDLSSSIVAKVSESTECQQVLQLLNYHS